MTQETNRDIDVIHEFTDFEDFITAVEGAVLLKLNFDIATEIREDVEPLDVFTGRKIVVEYSKVRYWLITIH